MVTQEKLAGDEIAPEILWVFRRFRFRLTLSIN